MKDEVTDLRHVCSDDLQKCHQYSVSAEGTAAPETGMNDRCDIFVDC
jgi:hypothetical protein